MNIFLLHPCSRASASFLTDTHTNKMMIESAQILSTAIQMTICERDSELYAPTHEHHPCVKWCAESVDNAYWVYNHYEALFEKFQRMFRKAPDDRPHQSWRLSNRFRMWMASDVLPNAGFTLPPCCMPDQYIVNNGATLQDVVDSYRQYYVAEKVKAASYRRQPMPYWIEQRYKEHDPDKYMASLDALDSLSDSPPHAEAPYVLAIKLH